MGSSRGHIKTLQERCAALRRDLLARRAASVLELDHYWPGGEENLDKNLWGWIKCYGNYIGFRKRHDPVAREQEREQRQRAILEALADQPENVTLHGVGEDGAHLTMTVYPKSDVALREIHNRNLVLASITDDGELITAHAERDDIELLLRVSEEQSYLQRVIVWIATTEGPGLPYPERTQRPDLPGSLALLSPIDYFLIAEVFNRVNVQRLAALQDSKTSDKRPDWPVFFASVAGELGMSTSSLMRDHSLASVLAAAAERARGHEEATARAKQDAKKPNGGQDINTATFRRGPT